MTSYGGLSLEKIKSDFGTPQKLTGVVLEDEARFPVNVKGFAGTFDVAFLPTNLPTNKPRHNYGLLAKLSNKLPKPQKVATTKAIVKKKAIAQIDHNAGPV